MGGCVQILPEHADFAKRPSQFVRALFGDLEPVTNVECFGDGLVQPQLLEAVGKI